MLAQIEQKIQQHTARITCFSTMLQFLLHAQRIWTSGGSFITVGPLQYLLTAVTGQNRRHCWGSSGRWNVKHKYCAAGSRFQHPPRSDTQKVYCSRTTNKRAGTRRRSFSSTPLSYSFTLNFPAFSTLYDVTLPDGLIEQFEPSV